MTNFLEGNFSDYEVRKLLKGETIKSFDCGDNDFHGHGVGTKLINFIKSYYKKGNNAGCRFLTVDAYMDAVRFYERNKFQQLQEDDTKTKLLYYDLNEMIS